MALLRDKQRTRKMLCLLVWFLSALRTIEEEWESQVSKHWSLKPRSSWDISSLLFAKKPVNLRMPELERKVERVFAMRKRGAFSWASLQLTLERGSSERVCLSLKICAWHELPVVATDTDNYHEAFLLLHFFARLLFHFSTSQPLHFSNS